MATPPVFTAGAILTAAQMNAVGLWKISETSFTSQTSIPVDGVFTSDFKNYKVVCNIAGGGAQNIGMIFRIAGVDTGGSNYKYQSQFLNYTGAGWATGAVTNTGTIWSEFLRIQASEQASATADIMGPQTANVTSFMGTNVDGFLYRVGGGILDASTQLTGFRLAATNACSGTIRVYGYTN